MWRTWMLVGLAACDTFFLPDTRPPTDAEVPNDDAVDAGYTCPPDYVPVAEAPNRYKIVERSDTSWLYAQDECRDDHPDHIAHLVVLDNLPELEAIKTALAANLKLAEWGGAWVGYGRDRNSAPFISFRSVTGVSLASDSPLWDDGGPTVEPNGPMETAVYIAWYSQLIDGPNEIASVVAYVCECDGIPQTALIDVLP